MEDIKMPLYNQLFYVSVGSLVTLIVYDLEMWSGTSATAYYLVIAKCHFHLIIVERNTLFVD